MIFFADVSNALPVFTGETSKSKSGPIQSGDPWKTQPRKVTARHTGWTPKLEMRKQQMNELLQRRYAVVAPLADVTEITPNTPENWK